MKSSVWWATHSVASKWLIMIKNHVIARKNGKIRQRNAHFLPNQSNSYQLLYFLWFKWSPISCWILCLHHFQCWYKSIPNSVPIISKSIATDFLKKNMSTFFVVAMIKRFMWFISTSPLVYLIEFISPTSNLIIAISV